MFRESQVLFNDRRDAGRKLAQVLLESPPSPDTIVLALPRGGVPVAYEVAAALNLPLDILAVRKLGAPGQEELAMGAIAGGGALALNAGVLAALGIREESVRAFAEEERAQLTEDERVFRNCLPPLDFTGRPVLLIDDGLATGATMRAAARAVRPRAREIVIAVPVAAPSTFRALFAEADRVLACTQPEPFEAVGRFYRNFDPTADGEVIALLAEARGDRQVQPVA
ncbi:MAG TPA: phosphoribosyltransferase family protein [Terracidiphilus sp.]|nr:phosphoribosyltransferase family protein [Terracidiphilus sp.]